MAASTQQNMLFDVGTPKDSGSMRHDESAFGFLSRTDRPKFAQGRLFFEQVFARYPEEHQAHLRSRFRSDRAEQHQGAILELLLFAALERHGVKVRDDTPDFSVDNDNEHWYLEATSLTPEKFGIPQGVRTVVGTIARELRSNDYYLSLSLRGSLKSTPSKKQYLRQLQDLLDTPWDESPLRRESIQIDGLRLTAGLIRKGSSRGISHSVIGIQSYGDAEIGVNPETSRAIWKTLAAKARKIAQKEEGERVWLAVGVPDDTLATGSDDLILDALYGVGESGSVSDKEERFWFRRGRDESRTRIEGVIALGPLLWWALDSSEMFCRLYLSPWTQCRPPMPIRRLPTIKVRADGKTLRFNGEKLGTLIGD